MSTIYLKIKSEQILGFNSYHLKNLLIQIIRYQGNSTSVKKVFKYSCGLESDTVGKVSNLKLLQMFGK